MLLSSSGSFLQTHGKAILLVLIPVIMIRIIRFIMQSRREQKRLRKEKDLAAKVRQDEALNEEILNPDRKPGDVTENKHPYKVVYYDQTEVDADGKVKNRGRGIPAEDSTPGRSLFRKDRGNDPLSVDTLLKITEYTGTSYKAYTYTGKEVVLVGSQYGKTGILPQNPVNGETYFEIFFSGGYYCLRVKGSERVLLIRGNNRKIPGEKPVILREGDRIVVDDKFYVIGLIR